MRSDPAPDTVRVVVEAGPLGDGRASAGIGRYLRSLIDALERLPAGERPAIRLATPRRAATTERRPLRYLRSQPSILVAAARWRPAVVHAVASEPAALWPLRRQVVTLHDVVPWTSAEHRLSGAARAYAALHGRRLRRCAAVIAVSPSVAADAREVLHLDPGRVHVVAEGVGAVFSPCASPVDQERRDAAGVTAGGYVLWSGSLAAHDPRKALDVLVDAMTALAGAARSEGREPPVLVLAGRGGAEATRVATRCAAAGVPAVVTGWVSDGDLAALLRGAGAVAVPSLHEGFGLPVLEALACAAPVVASRTGNIPDLAGGAAVLVAPGDARALAQALAGVLGPGSATAGRLRAAGPPRAAGFDWLRTAGQTAAVYRSVAAGLTAPR
ncbi:MAG TPA: glycosyltransferase family 1 protein [Candidatus Dormibacteraeota bacterium]|nr:glycosyltransferase family 1 protein [Candidatus Dormibacteraeota bacterium]